MIVVTAYYASAAIAMTRAGLDSRSALVVNTNQPPHSLRGQRPTADDVRLVPRWQDGDYAREVEHELLLLGVDLSEVEYLDL